MRVITNVTYLAPDRAEKLDVYLPEGRAAGMLSPGYVWIHGGGWTGGEKGEVRGKEVCTTLAHAGYVAVSVDYRLGDGSWPQSLLDCKNAVRFLRAHAKEYGVDPDRIAVGGGSAGGHLALMVGFTAGKKEFEPDETYAGVSDAVGAIINCYGPADLPMDPAAKVTGAPTGMRKLMGESLAVFGAKTLDAVVLRAASPTTYAVTGMPPVLTFHGRADTTVDYDQSVTLNRVLQERGVEHEFVSLDGVGHSFDFEKSGQQALPRDLRPVALAFLEKHLDPRSVHAQLTASMSDEQLLRALLLDPAALRSEKTQGKDGTTTNYSDATNKVLITRSLVSGVVVMRTKPVGREQTWELGRP